MPLIVRGDLLFTSDLQGLRAYDLGDPARPRLVASVDEPSAPNAFRADPDGEQLSGVCAGLLARSFTAPGQEGHWAEQHSSIGVYDTALRPVARFCAGRRLDDRSLALSPDGTKIASISRGEGVVLLDARSGAVLSQHEGEIGSGVSFSPDGRYLAAGDTGQADGELYLLDLAAAGGPARLALPAPSGEVPLNDSPYQSAWSPDGALVAFTSAAWGMRGVAVYDAASRRERWSDGFDMAGEEEEEWQALQVVFAAGGAVLLVGVEEGIRAYRAADGAPLRRLPCGDEGGPCFAADDARRLIFRVVDGAPVATPYPAEWTGA